MSKATEAKGSQKMAGSIHIKYRGRVLELSPETSFKVRKLAETSVRTVEETVIALLENARCAAPGLFLPARC